MSIAKQHHRQFATTNIQRLDPFWGASPCTRRHQSQENRRRALRRAMILVRCTRIFRADLTAWYLPFRLKPARAYRLYRIQQVEECVSNRKRLMFAKPEPI